MDACSLGVLAYLGIGFIAMMVSYFVTYRAKFTKEEWEGKAEDTAAKK